MCVGVYCVSSCVVDVVGSVRERLVNVLSLYRRVREDSSIILVPFTTIFDYGHLLKEISQLMR